MEEEFQFHRLTEKSHFDINYLLGFLRGGGDSLNLPQGSPIFPSNP